MAEGKTVILVIDFLNDFVTGAMPCKRAERIIPGVADLLSVARSVNIPIVYCKDAHLPNIDMETKVWGNHAIVGTEGAEIVPQLKPQEGDYIITKRRYSAFFNTDLKLLLDEIGGVETVIVTGLLTNICVKHTVADAFQYGYKIRIPKDATEAANFADYTGSLRDMKNLYMAEITDSETLVHEWTGAPLTSYEYPLPEDAE